MKISIVGGGNMGGAIALGLLKSNFIKSEDLVVINSRESSKEKLKSINPNLNVVIKDYSSISHSDITIIALKPWLVKDFLLEYKDKFTNPNQILVSVASGITLAQLEEWTFAKKPVYRIIPNTAIAIEQSMTFVTSHNATDEQDNLILKLFSNLGKVDYIPEKNMSAATSLSSCGIAYAFRYIRAAMEGGVEMGLYPNQSRDIVIQTLRGAIELLEANDSHPEVEIDKVTTPGGITIKGLNEMEHAGFTSSVIKGLKASNIG